MTKADPTRHTPAETANHRLRIVLHWGLALAIGLLALSGEWAEIEHGTPENLLGHLHITLGLLVLAISLPRTIINLWLRPKTSEWPQRLARWTQLGLLGLSLLIPLTGAMQILGHGSPLQLASWTLTSFDQPHRWLAELGHVAHEGLFGLMLGLIALHVAGALWHQYGRRDRILRRIWW